jgi:hypothetical protein
MRKRFFGRIGASNEYVNPLTGRRLVACITEPRLPCNPICLSE